MEEIHDLIPGKLKIIQNDRYFKFGSDSVFLTNFTKVKRGEIVVDLGSGSGVIPLLLAFKQEPSKVIGLELQSPLVDMARRSIRLNDLEGYIEIIEGDLKKITDYLKPESVDLVVSNPPYLPPDSGKLTGKKEIAIARHEIHASLRDVVRAASLLLRFDGRFTLVHRSDRLPEIFAVLKEFNLEPKRMQNVQSRLHAKPKNILIEARKGARPGLEIEPALIVYRENSGEYTESVKRIYGGIPVTGKGRLYICGTPIGNLDDLSFRVLKTLRQVSLIAAEDTRRTGQLLKYYEIDTPLTSYHEHNEREKAGQLLSLLNEGKDLALVSDAGMPGISDPGLVLIKRVLESGLEVIPVPGPTAAISALVVSGLDMDRFVFEGFLPRKGKEREERLAELEQETRTIIIYESPYRIKDTLHELAPLLKKRRLAVVRELTKIHEKKYYGTAKEVLKELEEEDEVKGEVVLVIEGREQPVVEEEGWEELSILEHLRLMLDQGFSKKQAINRVAAIRDISKKEVYQEAIAIEHID
jgi:16S rRNA (cytidine1402-2'-O)-methyltransferase